MIPPPYPDENIKEIRKDLKVSLDKKKSGQTLQHQVWKKIHTCMFDHHHLHLMEKNALVYAIIQTRNTGKQYTDLTERSPYRSRRGNNYVFVAYHFDDNVILALPIRNRQAKTITTVW